MISWSPQGQPSWLEDRCKGRLRSGHSTGIYGTPVWHFSVDTAGTRLAITDLGGRQVIVLVFQGRHTEPGLKNQGSRPFLHLALESARGAVGLLPSKVFYSEFVKTQALPIFN